MNKVKVGLFGTNGHQVTRQAMDHANVELVAVAGFEAAALPDAPQRLRRYGTLEQLLADAEIELISLCSPLRSAQAGHAVACLKAGKHVYAEKPCAFSEQDLDAVLQAAEETGMQFHEMAGTVVDRPYGAMRQAVQSGIIGEVVQVLAQKSYPWHDRRPADERIDGGLARQVGVYVGRFVEHIAGMRIASMVLEETRLGNPSRESQCRRAASFLMTLENGGVASAVCNYLNPLQGVCWGYEILRIFGTDGVVESNAWGGTARLLRHGKDPEPLDVDAAAVDYFDLLVRTLRGEAHMPLSMQDETRPTRWVNRAKAACVPWDGSASLPR